MKASSRSQNGMCGIPFTAASGAPLRRQKVIRHHYQPILAEWAAANLLPQPPPQGRGAAVDQGIRPAPHV